MLSPVVPAVFAMIVVSVPAYYPAVIRNEGHFYARQATCTAPYPDR